MRNNIDTRWNSEFAYVVGLITTDGSLSKDGRHIVLVSKDKDQIQNFAKILNLKNRIGLKASTYTGKKIYHQIQFSNVKLYRFLVNIGLGPNKTKSIGILNIPDRYFRDFLRGHLDGDGYTYSYWDKRWKKSYMIYTIFLSSRKEHLDWLYHSIERKLEISGRITKQKTVFRLVYAKNDSLKLLKHIYYRANLPCLKRKRLKVLKALGIIEKINREIDVGRDASYLADVAKLVDAHP